MYSNRPEGAAKTPRTYRRAADSIGRYTPVKPRLRVTESYDYEARGQACPAEAYLASLESPDSKRNMGYALDIYAAFLSGGVLERDVFPWHQMTAEHRDEIRSHLLERYRERGARRRQPINPASVNTRLIAWRQVLKHAWDKGLMKAEDYKRVANVSVARGARQEKRRFVPERDLEVLFRHCANDPNQAAGRRDAAILALLFGCGLRRFEAIALPLDAFDMREDGWLVSVIGKRNKERTLGVPIGAAAFVYDWLEIRGWKRGPLFFPIRKNGVILPSNEPMTTQVGNQVVEKRFLAAGVGKFSPHDLRATGTTILASLLDLFQTMRWAGHENADTTKGYVVTARNQEQRIAEHLNVPHFNPAASKPVSWGRLQPPTHQDGSSSNGPMSASSP